MLEIGSRDEVSDISDELFLEWAKICNEDGTKHIDLIGDYYVVNINEDTPKCVALSDEKECLTRWLREHDYIGTKIATGRATVEEYSDVIAEMQEKAERINEIDTELASLEKDIK